MKKVIILIFLINLIGLYCYANDLFLEKIVEYPTSGEYLGKDNQTVCGNYIYTANHYGLEIYELDASDDGVDLISRLPLYGDSRSINIKNNFAYIITISSSENYYQIYQIDICNPEVPAIINEITFYNEENFAKGYIFSDYFITQYSDENYNNFLKIVKIPELEYVNDYQYSGAPFIKLNNSKAIRHSSNNIFTLYDFSNPIDITQLNNINLSGTGLESPSNFKLLNDTLVVAASNNGLSFWNISDMFNWSLISVLEAPSNTWWCRNVCYDGMDLIFLPFIDSHTGINSVDISNILNPYILDSIYLNPPYFFASDGDLSLLQNNIFLGTWQKLYNINHNSGSFISQSEIYKNYLNSGSTIYDNYLYLSFSYGLGIYNITSPQNIIRVNSLLSENNISSVTSNSNTLALIDYTENEIKIYSLLDPANPIIKNNITLDDVSTTEIIFLDEENIYLLSQIPTPNLKKYEISEPGISTLKFSYELNKTGNGFIHNDHFYYLAKGSNKSDLQIIGGISNNQPEIITIIENLIEGSVMPYVINYNEYMYIYDRSASATSNLPKLYKICDTTDVEFIYNGNQKWMGDFIIKNNNLFVSGPFSYLYIYSLDNLKENELDPYETKEDFGKSYQCLFFEKNSSKYLFHLQRTAISVYEIKDQSIDSNNSINNLLTTYPNPFSTSTTISFNSKKPINKNPKIEIYNIKGQKVRSLTLTQDEILENANLSYSVSWDGKNKNNKEVAPGIYFCKIKTAENTFVSKMLRVE